MDNPENTDNQDFSQLIDILNETKEPLDVLGPKYFKNISKNNQFKIACGICVLLQDDVLSLKERLIGIYILYKFQNVDLSSNPFFPLMVSLLYENQNSHIIEKHFLSTLFSGPKDNFLKSSLDNILAEIDPNNLDVKPPDVSNLIKQFNEKNIAKKSGNPFKQNGIFHVVHDENEEDQFESHFSFLQHKLILKDFSPSWIRPKPPKFDTDSDKVVWLHPNVLDFNFVWDKTMSSSDNDNEFKSLMKKAFTANLLPSESKIILKKLEESPQLILRNGLSPKTLPNLIEWNPIIAIETLLKLMSSNQITEYFSVLVNMEMSLQSMEVVNRLTNSVELPKEFIHLYISNCISSCENIKEKFHQNRLVRLVCVFLQSLIKNKIINVKHLFFEVQSFCIQFSKIKEAAVLFRLLKSMENEDENGTTGNNAPPSSHNDEPPKKSNNNNNQKNNKNK